MALEYDRIPAFMKSQRSVGWQRKVATAVMIIVPVIVLAVAVIGGISLFRDHQSSEEMRRLNSESYADFKTNPPQQH